MNRIFTRLFTIFLLFLTLSLISLESYANFKYAQIKEFIPEGYYIFDTASGDFNADGYRDYILVLKSNTENINQNESRPLLILKGEPKGKFELMARNDHVVLCANCGGVWGDPYSKVSINGELLTVEHAVGGNWQWARVTTFKYVSETKEIVLNEDVTKSFQKSAPNHQKSIASNKGDFGTLPFSSYMYNKGF